MGNMEKTTEAATSPTAAGVEEFNWAVDNFTLQNGVLLIFGWVLHDHQDVRSCELVLTGTDGQQVHLAMVYGTERMDVAQVFSDRGQARFAGFHSFGGMPLDDIVRVEIEVVLADSRVALLPTDCCATVSGASRDGTGATARLQIYRHLLQRTLQHLVRGQFGKLMLTALRYLSQRPPSHPAPIRHLKELLRAGKGARHLIIDHDLGGGANQFRDQLIERLHSSGAQVLILSFHVPTLRYMVEHRRATHRERLQVTLDDFLGSLIGLGFEQVHFNNVVSFTRQLAVLQALMHLRLSASTTIRFYLHDFHSICPSHFLLDATGKYCGLPAIEQCRSCLPRIRDGLATLYPEKDIDAWRRHWLNFLAVADEIVCFSESSKALLRRAYPQVEKYKLCVEPHDMQDFNAAPVSFDSAKPLHLGIIGRINAHKGSRIVQELCDLFEAQVDEDRKITIFGTFDGRRATRGLTITGSYEREKLAEMVAVRGINMLAFTSVWPETFSFVISEMMQLGLPIICFDLGAPAERVAQYPLGRTVPLSDARRFMREIVRFHADLRQAGNERQSAAPSVSRPFPCPVRMASLDTGVARIDSPAD